MQSITGPTPGHPARSETSSLAQMAAQLGKPQSAVLADAAKPDPLDIPKDLRVENRKSLSTEQKAKLDAAANAHKEKSAMQTQSATSTSTKRPPVTTAAPKKGKATKAGFQRARGDGPSGLVVECLKLAGRAQGASRAELQALTKWTGTPWKWMFHNSKDNGWGQRWGYNVRAGFGKDGETRYYVTKMAAGEVKSKLTVDPAPKAAEKPAGKVKASATAKAPAKAKTAAKSKPRKATGKKKAH